MDREASSRRRRHFDSAENRRTLERRDKRSLWATFGEKVLLTNRYMSCAGDSCRSFLVRGWPRISLKRYRLATVRGMAAGLIDCSLEVRLRGLRSIFNPCRCTIRILGRHVNVRCTALTAFPHFLDRARFLFRRRRLDRYADAGGDFMAEAVDLPEKVWSALQQAAKASGLTPVAWIAAHLPAPADTDVARRAMISRARRTWSRRRTLPFLWNGGCRSGCVCRRQGGAAVAVSA